MCPLRENARKMLEETAMAVAAMAETTEIRLTRLESDVAHIKSDVADLKADVQSLRGELRGEFSDMRKEFAEVRREFAELHKELAANGKAIVRGDLMNRIWTLLICAAVLGVVARGLHWL